MNKIWILLISLTLLASCSKKQGQSIAHDPNDTLSGTIQISGAFGLYPMAVKWAEEFRKKHPNVKIDISAGGAGKGITDALTGMVDIAMVSRDLHPQEIEKGGYRVSVVKDAVVPVINPKNPEIENIRRIGLSQEKAARLWNKELTTWGQILGTSSSIPVHAFTRSDAGGAAETFAAWLGKKQENMKAIAIYGDPGIASAVQKDRVAIGYNSIAYVYDQKTKKPFEGITVIPIDVNGNGVIDPEEDFYDTIDDLVVAIQEGRYPSPPARDLFFMTKGKPTKPEIIAFLDFILTEGQDYALGTGFVRLSDEELIEETQKIK